MSRPPSDLGTNLTRVTELNESSEVRAVPRLDIRLIHSRKFNSPISSSLEDTGAHGEALGSNDA